jgi:hypothetical protein
MRPRFGFLTKGLALAFALAGIGAAFAFLNAGHQTTPGHGTDGVILCVLAVAFLAVGFGLAAELLWAWWAGVAISAATVVLDLLLAHDADWIPWLAFLAAFCVSAVQGVRDRSRAELPAHRG